MLYSKVMKYPISFELELAKNPYKGLYIAIEGIDGSGKTTQAHLLVENLKKRGKKVVYTKEPTDGEIGRFVREILAGKKKFRPVAFQYMFCADRVEHQERIMGYLKDGYVVVSDRCFWSAVPYGAYDRGIELGKGESNGEVLLAAFGILSAYHQFIAPDIAFYLDVSAQLAVERLSAARHIPDIYDKRKILERIQASYKWLVKQFPEEFVIIDGAKSPEEVSNKIFQIINNK